MLKQLLILIFSINLAHSNDCLNKIIEQMKITKLEAFQVEDKVIERDQICYGDVCINVVKNAEHLFPHIRNTEFWKLSGLSAPLKENLNLKTCQGETNCHAFTMIAQGIPGIKKGDWLEGIQPHFSSRPTLQREIFGDEAPLLTLLNKFYEQIKGFGWLSRMEIAVDQSIKADDVLVFAANNAMIVHSGVVFKDLRSGVEQNLVRSKFGSDAVYDSTVMDLIDLYKADWVYVFRKIGPNKVQK